MEPNDAAVIPSQKMTRLWSILVILMICCGFPFAEAREACTKLPRIQVQFVCKRNLLLEGFNATSFFEGYYGFEVFADRNGSGNNDKNITTTTNTTRNVTTNQTGYNNTTADEKPLPPQPYQLQLYASAGINRVEDVSDYEWFAYMCIPRNHTLVTIDVRGYFHWEEPERKLQSLVVSEKKIDPPHHYTEPPFEIPRYPDASTLAAYVRYHACGGHLSHFRANIREWDEQKYGIPNGIRCSTPSNTTFRKGGGYSLYPSSSVLADDGGPEDRVAKHMESYYEHRLHSQQLEFGYDYDHNLQYLCGFDFGTNVTHRNEYRQQHIIQGTSVLFVMVGVIFGFTMVLMIKAEYTRPLRYQQLPRDTESSGENAEDNNNSNDDNEDDGNDNDNEEEDEFFDADDGWDRGFTQQGHRQYRQEIELAVL